MNQLEALILMAQVVQSTKALKEAGEELAALAKRRDDEEFTVAIKKLFRAEDYFMEITTTVFDSIRSMREEELKARGEGPGQPRPKDYNPEEDN